MIWVQTLLQTDIYNCIPRGFCGFYGLVAWWLCSFLYLRSFQDRAIDQLI